MKIVSDKELPLYAVCAKLDGRLFGCAVSWVIPATLSEERPAIAICFSNRNDTLDAVLEAGCFSLNKMKKGQEKEVLTLGLKHSKSFDKFSVLKSSLEKGVPALKNSSWAICQVTHSQRWPDRTIVRADILKEKLQGPCESLSFTELQEALPSEESRRLKDKYIQDEALDTRTLSAGSTGE